MLFRGWTAKPEKNRAGGLYRTKSLFLLCFLAFGGSFAANWSTLDLKPYQAKMVTAVNIWQKWTNRKPSSFLPTPQLDKGQDLADLPAALPSAPVLGESERLERLTHNELLDDPMNRVNDEFNIPEGMRERVQFWFDIYTRHGRTTHVIHHTLYPWITYEILDFSEAIQTGKGPEWLRIDRANKYAKKRARDIRAALARLAANPGRRKNDLERHLVEVLKVVPGSRKKVYRTAAGMLRTQLGQKDFFISGLRRSSRYLPYMEETFFNAGLPLDLTRMPFVESSFNERAESKVGASGIWQVMPATGRAYGIVSEAIDERNSPLKATDMAARLLRSYRHALGSWPLAVTAYNHGIGNIEKAIRAARSRDLPTIIDRYHRGDFKFASSNFYACFLAALYAERYSEVAFPSVAREPALPHERFTITQGGLRLKHLADQGNLNMTKLLEQNLDLNRKYIRQISLPRGFVLHLPPGTSEYLPERLRARLKPASHAPSKISENLKKSKSAG
ncbi:MAG: lytic transglycosylase domain-containing protein [Bdellovibrionales bacterium]